MYSLVLYNSHQKNLFSEFQKFAVCMKNFKEKSNYLCVKFPYIYRELEKMFKSIKFLAS